jgi:NAD(P)-dependent dehydrogenase (short-subunit alcohol dehydrogenase family)
LTPIVKSQALTGTFSISSVLGDVSQEADANHMVAEVLARYGRLDILVNNAGDAVPPEAVICSTRLSTPPQFVSVSWGALNSLATPAGRTSETTIVTPFAAKARAVELPIPIALPQPVINATRLD